MMGIAHDALRRDLARTRTAISQKPYPHGRRRVAIADHVKWMMHFLHIHHAGEDEGLWPLLRAKAPEAAPLLDRMEADHAGIAVAVSALEKATATYADSDSDRAREDLLTALTTLEAALLPHLEMEERETMPVAETALTNAEWHDWSQKFYVKPKSFMQLGDEGHWLLDGLDAERHQVVVTQIPAVPRFILLHGFARRYRRRAALRWGVA
jgi:hypothetical protein